MLSKISTFISENKLICPKDKVLVGISGGPDSVCLLFVLLGLREELDFELMAVHVNHCLRGEEADRDQAFVEELCAAQRIPLQCVVKKVQERAEKDKLSIEEAGRICRYEVFRQEAERWGYNRIAVGHHGDDQAETMLFHLFRGTGLRGLAGMEPERDGLIRPLLCVERQEILKWLQEQRLSWRIDSTNGNDMYTRNRIRHVILSYIKEEINPKAVKHMVKTAEELSAIEHYMSEETERAFDLCVQRKPQGCFISAEPFSNLPSVLATRLIRRCFAETGRGLKDLERQHISLVEKLFQKQTGSSFCLPAGIRAIREYGGVYLGMDDIKEEKSGQEDIFSPQIPGCSKVGGEEWLFSLEKPQKDQLIPEKTYTKWFDYDKIENYLEIRTRKPGDYLEINQDHGRKKLKKFLIDNKISVKIRDKLFLLADGNHIIWIPGIRISEGYKVTENTRQVLKVQIYGGEKDGRENSRNDSRR